MVSAVLKAFDDQFAEGTGPKVATGTLIAAVLQTVVEQCEKVLIGGVGTTDQPADVKTGVAPVVSMLGVFGSKLFSDAEFSTVRVIFSSICNLFKTTCAASRWYHER